MNPLVSILIPAYNAEAWVGDAIESALNQTWPAKEIIVVDDGSTDQTVARARQYAAAGVKVEARPHGGASAARNAALALSQGDYIQWLDADDLLAPDKLERQLAEARHWDTNTLFASSWGRFRDDPDTAVFMPNALWATQSPVDWLVNKMQHNCWMALPAWLVHRDLVLPAGPWREDLLRDNDGEYMTRVMSASRMVVFVEGARSYVRRINPRSISNEANLSPVKLQSIRKSLKEQIACLIYMCDSRVTRQACVQYLQNWLLYFYPNDMAAVEEFGQIAWEMGGHLYEPQLAWKYRWIQWCFGWPMAKRAMVRARAFAARFRESSLLRFSSLPGGESAG